MKMRIKQYIIIVRGLPGSGRVETGKFFQEQHKNASLIILSEEEGTCAREKYIRIIRRTKQIISDKVSSVVLVGDFYQYKTIIPLIVLAARDTCVFQLKEPITPWKWDVKECAAKAIEEEDIKITEKELQACLSKWSKIPPFSSAPDNLVDFKLLHEAMDFNS